MFSIEDSFLEAFSAILDLSSAFDSLLAVAVYILTAIGLYRMAKACRHPRPWMAWIPYADYYLMGELAELSAARHGKKIRPYAAWMLTFQIVTTVVVVALVGILCSLLLNGLSYTKYSASTVAEGYDFVTPLLILIILLFVILALAIVGIILEYITLHLIFQLFDKKNALGYVILCIFISYAKPIVLLILSRKSPDLPAPTPTSTEASPETV